MFLVLKRFWINRVASNLVTAYKTSVKEFTLREPALNEFVWKITPRQRSGELEWEEYRKFLSIPAIYKLHNVREREIYIGCTQNAWRRFSQHLSLMGSPQHHNIALRRWSPNNVTLYVIEMLEQCDTVMLRDRERYWQDLQVRRSRTTVIVSRNFRSEE